MKLLLKHLLAQPVFPGDEDRTRKAHMLNTILLINAGILAVHAGLRLILADRSPAYLLLILGVLGGMILLRRQVFRGRLEQVSHLLVLMFSLAVTLVLYLSGTMRSSMAAGYVLVVVMAGLLMQRRSMILATLLCVAEFSLLTVLQANNLLTPRIQSISKDTLLSLWITYTSMIVYCGLFTYWIQKSINSALARARGEVAERKRVEEELRRSGEFFQGVINALEDPVLVKDGQQRYILLNESACAILGHSYEELIGRSDKDLFPPEAAAAYGMQDRAVLDSGQTVVIEEQILLHGEPRTIATKKSRYIDPATGERFVAASIRDVTSRRRMQEALEQARSSLEQQVLERTGELIAANRSLLDEITERRQVEEELLRAQRENDAFVKAAPGFLYMFNPGGRLVRWNKRLSEELGYTNEELAQMRVRDILLLDGNLLDGKSIFKMLHQGEVFSAEVPFRAKDGRTFLVYGTAAGVMSEDGLRYVVGIGIDISARASAETALRESEQRYRTLVEASPDFIVVFDEELNFLYANPSLVKISATENLDLYISPESEAWLRETIHNFLQSEAQVSGTIERAFNGRDGSIRWFSGVLARITYQGRPALLALARDVTQRKETEAALAQSQERLRALLDATKDVTFLITPNGNFLAVNQAAADSMGVTQEELLGANGFTLMPPELGETRRERMLEVIRTGKPVRFEDDGLIGWSDNSIYPVFSSDGSVDTLAVFSRDITERKKAEESLRKSEERYALAARGANDLLWDRDLTNQTFYVSPRWTLLLGYDEDHPMTEMKQWLDLIHPEDRDNVEERMVAHLAGLTPHYECEYRLRHMDGSYRWVLSRGLAVRDALGRPSRIAGSISDISQQKTIEARLLHDALHDAATGLPNRALLADRLEQTIKAQRRQPDLRFAVLYMDLDRFKDINDSLGHSVGDRLLIAVAQRVQACLREADTLARLGGDEFVILLPTVTGVDDALGVAERIQAALRQPFDLGGIQSFTSASIGVVLCDGSRGGSEAGGEADGRASSEKILRDADIAMYRAKALGRARCAVFDASMHSQVMLRMRLENDLRQAISSGELEIHYMPIVSLNGGSTGTGAGKTGGGETGCCDAFEALVRWRHPERGLISPADFIPMAEESLLIIPLDRWVLREACRQIHAWQKRWPELKGLKVNVNLSGKQFAQPDLIDQITSALRSCALSPACLRVEITESALIENIELANRTLRHLQELGVEVEIDDFGTGFSALTYLYQLPVNTLKIDRSFINQVGIDPRKTEIVKTVVTLAHNIGLDVVAEGVETPEQAERLRAMGCDHGQGFLFSRPMTVEEAERYIEERLSAKPAEEG